jgi:condensin complex subunit 3
VARARERELLAFALRAHSHAVRPQDQGEAGDYAECAVTAALLSLLECDKSKDVRKAVVSSVAVSHATLPALVERTRDLSQDVRRTAFLMLANKVPLGDLSIASRATVLRRGLADRETPVRAAAVVMLGKWMDGACVAWRMGSRRGGWLLMHPFRSSRLACKGDVVRLLAALDVETHEARACAAYRTVRAHSPHRAGGCGDAPH